MGTDARVLRNLASMHALRSLLIKVIAEPESYFEDKVLAAALSSQSALAKYESEGLQIKATSINTLKRIAERSLEGGFIELDTLRIAALNEWKSYETRCTSPKRTRLYDVQQKLKSVELSLQIALQDNWIATMAFERSLKQARYYARQASDPRVLSLCEREQRELRAMFSLRQARYDQEEK